MEVRFAKLLNENGVKAEQTTAKIKELIETFNEAWEEYQEKIEEVENASEDEQDALVEEIEQFELDAQIGKTNVEAFKAEAEAKATAKAELLERLGITAEEAQLLLGGN